MALSLGDDRLDFLAALYEEAAIEISEQLAEMPFVDVEGKEIIYLAILKLVESLREQTRDWAFEAITDIYAEADELALDALYGMGIEEFLPETEDIHLAEIDGLIDEFLGDADTALLSVQSAAARLRSGKGLETLTDTRTRQALAAGVLGGAAALSLKRGIRDKIRGSVVQIIGKNGRGYGFSLDYYIALAAQQKKYVAMTTATVVRSLSGGNDLLQVSPQPSTIGDYCDEYRGKIVSISGTHPYYPSITMLPGGAGAPFHPHCHHWMQVYDGSFEDRGPISQEFLDLAVANPDAQPWDYQRLWVGSG